MEIDATKGTTAPINGISTTALPDPDLLFCAFNMHLMKYLLSLFALTILINTGSSQDPFIEDFKSKWQNARAYTLEFAKAMPADKYDFAPVPEEMTFARQLVHMCGNMIWLSTDFLNGPEFPLDVDHPSEKKEDVIRLLEASFDHAALAIANFSPDQLDDTVEFFAGEMTRRRIFFLMTDHVTHHRGQLVVYLRLNGITPPRYRGW